jgi:hypothetical protein
MPELVGLEKRVGLHYNAVSNRAVAGTPLTLESASKKPQKCQTTAKVRLEVGLAVPLFNVQCLLSNV